MSRLSGLSAALPPSGNLIYVVFFDIRSPKSCLAPSVGSPKSCLAPSVLEWADPRGEGQRFAHSDLDGVGPQSASGVGGAGFDDERGVLAGAEVGLRS